MKKNHTMKQNHTCKTLLLAFLCCLLLASCGKEKEKNVSEGSGGGIENATPTAAEDGGGFSKKMDEDGALGEGLRLEGKAFGELSVVGEEDAVYCNLPENVTDWNKVVPLCPDPLYGMLYYVDYGGDYMIHAIYNGESQTVLEVPGRRLFCRGGKLYFLLESYNQFKFEGAKSGNIAEYDPVTGKVRVLSDETFDSIVVYQDMIYCKSIDGDATYDEEKNMYIEQSSYWFYFFETEELVQQDRSERKYALNFQRYGEYFFAASLELVEDADIDDYRVRVGMELRKWDGTQGSVWDGFMPGFDYYVKDGRVHWLDRKGFHVWDIASGQEQVYLADCEKENGEYTVVGGRLVNQMKWLSNLEDGTCENWFSMDEKLKTVHDFYTDGENLYAIVGPLGSGSDKNSVLRQVQMKEGVEREDLAQMKKVTEVGVSFRVIGK